MSAPAISHPAASQGDSQLHSRLYAWGGNTKPSLGEGAAWGLCCGFGMVEDGLARDWLCSSKIYWSSDWPSERIG